MLGCTRVHGRAALGAYPCVWPPFMAEYGAQRGLVACRGKDSAVVDELEGDIEFVTLRAFEQGDDRLEVVARLGGDAQFIALDLRFDTLGAFLADQL